ncbi:MAG: Nramp family divalent metal transporter [Opitutaceae bacterium]|nr:Nramp family divalent metal transporter [Opitutaceae bacterium]
MPSLRERLRSLGPGLVLAAAGIGAGDVVVASVTGISFGTTLLWAVVFTVALKFVVTEALARWQLATGETVVHAWVTRLPRWVAVYFAGYLLLWTFLVGASLSSACGLAGASLFPQLSVPVWGAIHAALAAVLVATNRYSQFQQLMKVLVGIMATCVLGCALVATRDIGPIFRGLFVPRIPAAGGGAQVLALLGGIGGSLTVICYGYWMRAAGWRGADKLPTVRGDLGLAYVFTGFFGIALIVIAAGVEAKGAPGARIALDIAARLETVAGPAAHWIFIVGFWCTVFTAMLGVWQGVPQVYVDLVTAWRGAGRVAVPDRDLRQDAAATPVREHRVFMLALAYLAGPPLGLLWFRQPVAVVVMFSIAGAFFMPFLAGTLLYLNNRRDWMGGLANRSPGNAALIVCLLAFGLVCVRELLGVMRS